MFTRVFPAPFSLPFPSTSGSLPVPFTTFPSRIEPKVRGRVRERREGTEKRPDVMGRDGKRQRDTRHGPSYPAHFVRSLLTPSLRSLRGSYLGSYVPRYSRVTNGVRSDRREEKRRPEGTTSSESKTREGRKGRHVAHSRGSFSSCHLLPYAPQAGARVAGATRLGDE